MATGRGRALREHDRGAASETDVSASPGTAEIEPSRFTPAAIGGIPRATRVTSPRVTRFRNGSRSFAIVFLDCSKTVNAGTEGLDLMPSMKPKPGLHIESMPPEMLLKIFSCLDVASLFSVGCVCKRFYHLANDNGIWLKIYSSSFQQKWTLRKMEFEQTETVSLGSAALHDKNPGYWKEEYVLRQIADVKTRVMQPAKTINPCTGLPFKCEDTMKFSGLSWIIVVTDKNGKEYVMDKGDLSFNDTSVTAFWYNANWPCLDILSTLKLFGVIPLLLNKNTPPSNNGPRLRSLIAEYRLANMTESSVAVGADNLVQLYSLNPGLLVGLWKDRNEIAFVMACLHYHLLLERSTLGSATAQYALPPHKPVLKCADPEYGLHDYSLHLDIHDGMCTNLCGMYRGLFCRKGDFADGYIKLTVITLKDTMKPWRLTGKPRISWESYMYEGCVKDCYMMNVTLLDETGNGFWCFSAPVYMELSSKASGLYDCLGTSYTTDYADSEGKVCIEFLRLKETEECVIANLVLYISTKKVNDWYGTDY